MSKDKPRGRWAWTSRNVTALAVLTLAGAALLAYRWRAAPARLDADLTITPAPMAPAAEKIDPNTATWASLARLPRIGPANAKAICAYRDEFARTHPNQRPFTRPADLTDVKRIGPATVEAIRPYLIFPPERTNEVAAPAPPR